MLQLTVIMAESVLEQVVVKLSCRAFELESERDHWQNRARSLAEELARSQTALTHAHEEVSDSQQRLKESQTQSHHDRVRQIEVDYQLRAIVLAASVIEEKLREGGEESRFVKATLHTLQEIVKKNDVRSTVLSVRTNSADRRATLRSSACWDESTSESD